MILFATSKSIAGDWIFIDILNQYDYKKAPINFKNIFKPNNHVSIMMLFCIRLFQCWWAISILIAMATVKKGKTFLFIHIKQALHEYVVIGKTFALHSNAMETCTNRFVYQTVINKF